MCLEWDALPWLRPEDGHCVLVPWKWSGDVSGLCHTCTLQRERVQNTPVTVVSLSAFSPHPPQNCKARARIGICQMKLADAWNTQIKEGVNWFSWCIRTGSACCNSWVWNLLGWRPPWSPRCSLLITTSLRGAAPGALAYSKRAQCALCSRASEGLWSDSTPFCFMCVCETEHFPSRVGRPEGGRRDSRDQ